MGFIIKYSRFLSITIEEEGTGESISVFRFFPTRQCQEVLRNYNLVFRSFASGFAVYYSETPLIPIAERLRFTFGFSIPDSGFFQKYGLVKTGETDPTTYQPGLYFDNLASDGSVITTSPASLVESGSSTTETVVAADTYRIYRQTFNVYDPAASPPSSYQLTNKIDAGLTQTIPVSPVTGMDYLVTTINSVDLKEDYISEPGPYVLQTDTDPPPDRNVYLNDELGQKSAQGVIDIYWETAQNTVADPDTGQQYIITFKPK